MNYKVHSFKILFIIIILLTIPTIFHYDRSFGNSSNSTTETSNHNYLKIYKIENEIKLAIKNIPININYTLSHIQKAVKLVDPDLKKELLSLEPRVINQIQNEITNLKSIPNSTVPVLLKGVQGNEGLSHIVDLIELLEISKIKNETNILDIIPSFFNLLNRDILDSYNNSNVTTNNNQNITSNNATKISNSNSTTTSFVKSLDYQTAQGYSNGVSEFIDNVVQFKPEVLKYNNMTKIKNEYSILNQLIENKSDIIKIEDFIKQNFKY